MNLTPDEAKSAARALRRSLAAIDLEISHGRALEIVAHQLGHADWNTASARLSSSKTDSGPAVPVLRTHDAQATRDFYVDGLGFDVEWEHRFEPDLPLYLRVRRDRTVFDLSEHHGDGTPGSVVWIPVVDVATFHADVSRRLHPRWRPGIDVEAPGGPTVEVVDPSGNVLRFCEVRGS